MIEYRNHTETTIERVAQCKLPTEYGEFELVTYRDIIDKQIHFALRKGDITSAPTLVRVHLQDTFTDLLHSNRAAERSWPLATAMQRIGQEGGVLVILGHEESSELLLHRVKMFELQDKGEALRWPKNKALHAGSGLARKSLLILE